MIVLFRWGADEVGVRISNMKVKFATTRKTIRSNLSHDHITIMITSNVLGMIAPGYFLFPGTDIFAIPKVIAEREDQWSNVSPNGYMDEERFQYWMGHFLAFIKKNQNNDENNDFKLLIVDGHNSRLNPSIIFTAALNRLIVFVGPSNLTNCWQAHDSGVNKKFKDLIKPQLASFLELKQPMTLADIAKWCIQALGDELKPSIVNSWKHVGIYPLDRSRIEQMIKNEMPDQALLKNPAFQAGVDLAFEKMEELDHLSGLKRKMDEAEKEARKKPKNFDTNFAATLTAPDRIVYLMERKEKARIQKLKVKPLRAEMITKLGLTDEQLKQPKSKKYRTKKELQSMVDQHFEVKHNGWVEKVKTQIHNVVHHPRPLIPLAPLSGQDEQ